MRLYETRIIATLMLSLLLSCSSSTKQIKQSSSNEPNRAEVNVRWQSCVIDAINLFPKKGGYYTGGKPNADFSKTTLQALKDAFKMQAEDARPEFDPNEAQPSFCSSATYAVLIKALLLYDTENKISKQAWLNMKPQTIVINGATTGQDDGVGFWGRANANGPGVAILVHELKAGYNLTAYRGAKSQRNKETSDEHYQSDSEWESSPIWNQMKPGDILKIFWNRNESNSSDCGAIIGYNSIKTDDQERGHSVVFTGFDSDGNVCYWSSNGPGKNNKELGYSFASCAKTRIQRIVVTRITNPENFDNARTMSPDNVNQYLNDLNGKRHSATAEMKQQAGIK